MTLPTFRYHPDAIRSGSIAVSGQRRQACGRSRGYIYTGPVYSDEYLDDAVCPWCIADGSVHDKFEACFVDTEAFSQDTPESAIEEISLRTPGYNSWQNERWPSCCGDAAMFLAPVGTREIRKYYRELEGGILRHIVHNMKVSGDAVRRLLEVCIGIMVRRRCSSGVCIVKNIASISIEHIEI